MTHSTCTRERKDDGGNIQYLTVSQWFFYKDKDRMEVNSNSFFIYMQQQSLSLLSIDFQHTINNFYYY